MRHHWLEAGACLLVLLAGCARSPSGGGPVPDANAVNGGTLVTSNGAIATAQQVPSDRPIGAADLLDITVFEVPELSRTVRVSDAGEISLPLLGVTAAAGKTPRELEASLRAQLQRSYMHDPQVTVEVKELGTPPIYVIGEVNKPGAFMPSGRSVLTVLRAVAMASGTTTAAAPGRIVVIRSLAGGERVNHQIDLNDIVRGKRSDFALQANDVVYVPKNTERSIALGAVEALIRTVTFRAVF